MRNPPIGPPHSLRKHLRGTVILNHQPFVKSLDQNLDHMQTCDPTSIGRLDPVIGHGQRS